jgi:hypothetical protein
VNLEHGMVVLLDLNPTIGHEQRGVRPCIVVSDPEVIADQRFPLVAVVPVTGTTGVGALYPMLNPGQSGLTKVWLILTFPLYVILSRSEGSLFCSPGNNVTGDGEEILRYCLRMTEGAASNGRRTGAMPRPAAATRAAAGGRASLAA